MNIFSNFFRIVPIIDQKSQDAYTVRNAGIHTFGYVPTGVRQRPDGVRLANSHFSLPSTSSSNSSAQHLIC